jgi:hypothetical protein
MRAALALAVTLAGAAPALAVPMPPLQLKIVPVYSTPLAIKLTWIERGDATAGYDIERGVDGGPLSFLARFPRGTVGQPIVYLDKTVIAASEYTYRVKACDATTCVDSSPFTTSPKVMWPIAGGHEVMHGFNEVSAWNGAGQEVVTNPVTGKPDLVATGYHMGLDVNKTTADGVPGDIVVAPRGGIVITPILEELDNGWIGIRVDVGGGLFETDTFNHIATTGANAPPVEGGDVVVPGQPIAHIGLYANFPGNFAKHVHYMQERIPIPAGQQRTIRHPLRIFTDPADLDPLGKPPDFFDENKDGKIVLFRAHQPGGAGAFIAYDFVNTPLRGDVDVEAEVMDEQGNDPRQAPMDLGYWIEGPIPDGEQHDDVKSAARPYRLYDFREEYFGGIPPSPGFARVPPAPCDAVSDIVDATNSGCRGLMNCTTHPGVACNSVITEGTTSWNWPVLHHFIVTHAKGEEGKRADVDRNQFWRTAAKDDGAPVDSTHANYAGQPTTTKAWEARFPDGDYVIHVIASDLVHDKVDLPIRDSHFPQGPQPGIRLENFAPFVKEMIVARDADENPATGQPMLAGCESVIHHYRHTPRQPYGRAQDVLISRVATTIVRSGQQLCVLIRFSEPVMSATVDLVRDRGTGAPVPGAAFTGSLSKTYNTDDTWIGTVALPIDQSGASDASPAGDEHDTAIRIVALDRRDATGTARGLDANSDGIPETGGADLSHVVKLDLSLPTGSLDAEKP